MEEALDGQPLPVEVLSVLPNQPIVRGSYLKEAFQRFWDYRSEGWAQPSLKQWLWRASYGRLEPFVRFARMIREHLAGILAWTRLRVANGGGAANEMIHW